MKYTPFYMDTNESEKLILSGNGDAAILFIYLRNGNDIRSAKPILHLSEPQFNNALETLKALGLWQSKPMTGAIEKPRYTEADITAALSSDMQFNALYAEVERRLGRILNTEELKILLGMVNYLGLPNEVICILISFCVSQEKKKGRMKPPTMYQIEKEAYRWADNNIDSIQAAFDYIHKKEAMQSRIAHLMSILQIRGRTLTGPEEQFAREWLQMGLSDDLITKAYEKTCVNTGGMNWAYMNKILHAWKDAGYRTAEDTSSYKKAPVPMGASGHLGEAELEAIQRILQEA